MNIFIIFYSKHVRLLHEWKVVNATLIVKMLHIFYYHYFSPTAWLHQTLLHHTFKMWILKDLLLLGNVLGDLPADASEGKHFCLCISNKHLAIVQKRLRRDWLLRASQETPPSRWWQLWRAEDVSIDDICAFKGQIICTGYCVLASGNVSTLYLCL